MQFYEQSRTYSQVAKSRVASAIVQNNSEQQVSVFIQPDLPAPGLDVSPISAKGITFNYFQTG